MTYIDGFVVPILRKNVAAYQRLSRKAEKVWRGYGALDYKECLGDDLKHKGIATFDRAARIRKGETVVFSWILYRSRAHRDRVNAKVMKDPRILKMMDPDPGIFDAKRMVYGGFRTIVGG
jgi:uncharacterized protein YbaA (DUF1428 family)